MLRTAKHSVFWLAILTILTALCSASGAGPLPKHRSTRHKRVVHTVHRRTIAHKSLTHLSLSPAPGARTSVSTHLFGASVAALSREIARQSEEADRLGGPDSEGPDYLEAQLFYLQQRAFPRDSVDWSAWATAADHRDQMPIARTPGFGNDISGKWTFLGPNALPVPYQKYFGVGPLSGRVNSVVYDPSHAGTYYISAAGGGVWKTADGGNTWTPLSNGPVWKAQQAGSIALDPNAPNTLFVAATDSFAFGPWARADFNGILHTADGGATWDALDTSSFGNVTINKIVADPDTPGLLMAVTGTLDGKNPGNPGNIWRSLDSGKTWTKASPPAAFWTDLVYGLLPAGGTRYYYACGFSNTKGYELYRSANRGATWTKLTTPLSGATPQRGIDVAASAIDPKTVYLMAGANGRKGIDGQIFKSPNAGGMWNNITNNFPDGSGITGNAAYNWTQSYYDYFIGCSVYTDAQNVSHDAVYVGLIDVVRSLNGGGTWQSIGGPSYVAGSLIHNDQHAWAVNPTNPNDMLVGNDGGVFHLQFTPATGTSSFTSLNAHLGTAQFYHLDVDQAIDGLLLGGTQDNATPALTGSVLKWSNVAGGDGSWAAINPANPNIQYATSSNNVNTYTVNVYRTINAWKTPSQQISFTSNVVGDIVAFFSPILALPSDTSSLYAATRALWKYDPTASPVWSPTGNKLLSGNNGYVLSMACGCAGNTIYTGSLDGFVFRTPDAGTTWSTIGSPLLGLPNLSVPAISVDPSNANSVLVGFGGTGASHLWQCLDTSVATPKWINVSGAGATGLPDIQLNAIARDPGDPVNTWYVGTDVGVFQTTNAGQTWANATQPLGLPNAQVNDLRIAPGTGYLYAATFGRGIWRMNLSGKGVYNVIDLDLAGDSASQALALNRAMNIVGSLLTPTATNFGIVWTTPQTSITWGTLNGGTHSFALAMNNVGAVVGYADDSNGTDHVVEWFQSDQRLHNLETENQELISQANGINDSGVIVGRRDQHAFVYQSSVQGFIDMRTLGGSTSAANAINNAPKPQIVGWAITAAGSQHAFLHNGIGPMTAKDDLGTLGGVMSQATAVNDLGEVVGFSTTANGGGIHAFKTSPNAGIKAVKSDLGTLGSTISYAYAISDNGLVVGSSYDANGDLHAFIWSPANGMQDLNNLIPANSGWTLESANGICDCGCIVGYGIFNSKRHAFLLMF